MMLMVGKFRGGVVLMNLGIPRYLVIICAQGAR